MERAKENGLGVHDPGYKSVKTKFWAYFFWLFGGLFGAHHMYLGRDDQAFVYISTFGGYIGCGFLRDIYRIPAYVADANNDPAFIEDFKRKVRANRKVNKYSFRIHRLALASDVASLEIYFLTSTLHYD